MRGKLTVGNWKMHGGLAENAALRAEMGRAARAHIEATRSLERLPATLREFYSAVPVH